MIIPLTAFCTEANLLKNENQEIIVTSLCSSTGQTLSNAIELISWKSGHFYPRACESCWQPECDGRRAQMRRLGGYLLWSDDQSDRLDSLPVFGQSNVYLFRREIWDELVAQFPCLPLSSSFPCCTRTELGSLWLLGLPRDWQASSIDRLQDRLVDIVCADLLDRETCIHELQRRLDWLKYAPNVEAETSSWHLNGPVVTVYIDDGQLHEWAAFVDDHPLSFVLDSEYSVSFNS